MPVKRMIIRGIEAPLRARRAMVAQAGGNVLPGTGVPAADGAILHGYAPPCLPENLKKKCRCQKILILMMKRLNRTGVLLLPGNQEVEAEVSNQNE